MRDRFPVGTFQFVLFLIVAAVVIPFGINYVAGPEGFGAKLRLHVAMADAFGLTAGTGVTVRGVDVGTVSSTALAPGGGAAAVELVLDGDTKIPRDSFVQVTMASMAGIQSVDIVTGKDTGIYLRDGDSIAAPADRQPLQMDKLISEAARLLGTFRAGSAATVSTELASAFGGDEQSLTTLITNGAALAKMVRKNAPLIKALMADWLSALGAMDDTRGSFETGMGMMASFTDQLDAAQPTFVYLLDQSPAGLSHATALFDKYRGTFGGVLANLVVVEPIVADRTASLATGLQTIPQGLMDLRSIVKNNRADFALIGTQGPVCLFYDEPRRAIGDLSPSNPNLTRYCPPGNSYGQRGAVNAPRPNGLGTGNWKSQGGASGPAVVDDPLLIPNATELMQMWSELLERARNGN